MGGMLDYAFESPSMASQTSVGRSVAQYLRLHERLANHTVHADIDGKHAFLGTPPKIKSIRTPPSGRRPQHTPQGSAQSQLRCPVDDKPHFYCRLCVG